MFPSSFCLKGIIFHFLFLSFFSSVRTAFKGCRLPTSCKRHTETGSGSSERVRCSLVWLDPVPSLYWRFPSLSLSLFLSVCLSLSLHLSICLYICVCVCVCVFFIYIYINIKRDNESAPVKGGKWI